MKRDDSQKPGQNNLSWARFVERRRQPEYHSTSSPADESNSNADQETRTDHIIDPEAAQKKSSINDVAIDDLSMDAMLNMLPRTEHGADIFTNKVLAKLNLPTTGDHGEKQKSEKPNGKPALKQLATEPKKINGHRIQAAVDSSLETQPSNRPIATLNKTRYVSRRSKRNRMVIAIAAAIALFGIGLTIGFVLQPNQSTPDRPISEQKTPPKKNGADQDLKQNSPKHQIAQNDLSKDRKDNAVKNQNKKTPQQTPKQIPDFKKEPIVVKLPKDSITPKNRQVENNQPKTPAPNQVVPQQAPKFASIVDASNATWSSDHTGDLRQKLSLRSGNVQVETPKGVKVQIVGPARFQFLDAETVHLEQGFLSANVGSNGKGFSIKTPGSHVVDLGTEFEVSVTPNGDSRVYVKSGSVEVEPQNKKTKTKWRQYTEQTSVVSKSGKKTDWVLSMRFDDNGFGHIEFNGEVLDQFITHDNAPFVLQNICSAVGPKLKAVQPYLKDPVRGAICVDSEFTTFDKPEQLETAYKRAVKIIKSRKFKSLDIGDLVNARQRFENWLQYTHRQIRKEANVRNQMPMISVNVNASGVTSSIQFPATQIIKKLGTSSEAQVVQSVAQSTEKLLNHLAKEQNHNSKKRNNRRGRTVDPQKKSDARQPNVFDMFQQFANSQPFGDMLGNQPANQGLEKFRVEPLLQRLDEDQLTTALYNHVGEVRGFTDPQIREAIARYTKIANQSRAKNLSGKKMTIGRGGINFISDHGNAKPTEEPLKTILPQRHDLNGMPFVMGHECRLNKDDTLALDKISKELGTAISRFNFFGSLPTFAVATNGSGNSTSVRNNNQGGGARHFALRQTISQVNDSVTNSKKSVSGLVQMLQADKPMIRYELLKNLDKIKTQESIEALAKRAIYDLSPEIRSAAVQMLEKYPKDKYRKVFVDAFNYPWAPVAQHSAEALVRLKDTEAIPELIELIDRPDPSMPFKNKQGKTVVREVVAINHMKNCLLCHAPSTDTSDSLRGLMPSPGQPLPRQYYQSQSGGFVRADVTYLKQDFSVTQPVPDAKHWPKMQRFDYVVRQRALNPVQNATWEKTKTRTLARHQNMHRAAVLFALRELTGKFPQKDDAETWRKIAEEAVLEKKNGRP